MWSLGFKIPDRVHCHLVGENHNDMVARLLLSVSHVHLAKSMADVENHPGGRRIQRSWIRRLADSTFLSLIGPRHELREHGREASRHVLEDAHGAAVIQCGSWCPLAVWVPVSVRTASVRGSLGTSRPSALTPHSSQPTKQSKCQIQGGGCGPTPRRIYVRGNSASHSAPSPKL